MDFDSRNKQKKIMGILGVFLGAGGKSEGSKPKVYCTEVGRKGSSRASWGKENTEGTKLHKQGSRGF